MPDRLSQLVQEDQAAPAPAPATPQPVAQPQDSSEDDILNHMKATSKASPSPVSPHGMVYNAADKLLNWKPADATDQDIHNETLRDATNSINNNVSPVSYAQGAAKSLLGVGTGLGSIYNKVTGSDQPFSQENLRDLLEAHGFSGNAGKLGGDIAQFMTGEGAASKVISNPRIIKALAPLVTNGIRAKLANKALELSAQSIGGGIVGGIQSGGDPTSTALNAIAPVGMSALTEIGGRVLQHGLGVASGAGADAIERAFDNPVSNWLAKAMRGEIKMPDVVQNVQDSVTKFRDDADKKYSGALDAIKNSPAYKNWGPTAKKIYANTNASLNNELKNFNVITRPDGTLDMKQVSGMDTDRVKELIGTIRDYGTRELDPVNVAESDTAKAARLGRNETSLVHVDAQKLADLIQKQTGAPISKTINKKLLDTPATAHPSLSLYSNGQININNSTKQLLQTAAAMQKRIPVSVDPAQAAGIRRLVGADGVDAEAMTPAGLDNLKKRINDFAGDGGKMGAMAGRIYDVINGNLGANIKGYSEMTGDYHQASQLLRGLKSEVKVNPDGSINPGTTARSIQNLFKNQTNEYKKSLLDRLPNGRDLQDQIAGLHLNEWTPRGINKALAGSLFSGASLIGGLHPSAIPYEAGLALASSPRLVGEGARLAGKIASNKQATSATRAAIQSGINSISSPNTDQQ